MDYPIHELFHSFQGEGEYMGCRALFIRMFGCPLHCPFCDSAGTWHKNYIPADIKWYTVEELVVEAKKCGAHHVIITGGEPAVHELAPLVSALHGISMCVHIETSGAYQFYKYIDWITVSPKKKKLPLPSSYVIANEFKFIIETPEDIGFWMKWLTRELIPSVPMIDKIIWLHPEWSQRHNLGVLDAITHAVCDPASVGSQVELRAGYQIHKLYMADALDSRSRSLSPLGGDPNKGY